VNPRNLTLALLLLAPAGLFAQVQLKSLRIEPGEALLAGAGASQQLLAIGTYTDGTKKDLTQTVRWSNSPSQLVELNTEAMAIARMDGVAVITASVGAHTARSTIRVKEANAVRTFQFDREIGGILTRKGCNGAGCHGGVKGRGGFKLSAGALFPKDDYDWIVKGGTYQVLTAEVKGERRPRIDTGNPAKSLILLKATLSIPHGGGRRFPVDSPEYRTILDWVAKGAPYGEGNSRENRVERLDVFPSTVALEKDGSHHLLVTAHFADGRREDFTHQALYVSNNQDVAKVDENGLVKAGGLGETSVLIRAAGQAVSATVGVMGPLVAHYPEEPRNNFIDDFIFEKLRSFRIVPSGLSSDTEFLRRLCLDMTGTLPPPQRVREFAASKDSRKREMVIDALLQSPEFTDYWTFRFDDLMRVAVTANGIAKWSNEYGEWVRQSIATNKPYDQMARERIASEGYSAASRHYLPYNVIGPPGETMGEEIRVFFGRRLDCAQCHNHPYETWSQDQYWGLAAFFGRLFKMGSGDEYTIFDLPVSEQLGSGDVNGEVKLLHPRTKVELKPTLLDGTVIRNSGRDNPRNTLADWMVKHPYFAEAAVNRMWSQFFGRGIVDPVDDFRSTNPPTHPELLRKLAADFREHHHDLRHLIRTIVTSRAYQLSSVSTDGNQSDHTNYSHSMPRPLDAEVLLDAICDVTAVPEVFTVGVPDASKPGGRAPLGTRAINLRQPDLFYSRFLELYGRPNRLTLPERSGKANLRQALHMLAGPVYNEKLSSPQGRLQVLLQGGKTDAEIIDEFYLAALSRLPEEDEKPQLEKMIAAAQNRTEAIKDFVWALLCSREFSENH